MSNNKCYCESCDAQIETPYFRKAFIKWNNGFIVSNVHDEHCMVCNRTTRFIPYILDDQLKFKTKLMPAYTDVFIDTIRDTCAIVLFGLIVGGAACIAEDIYGKLKE